MAAVLECNDGSTAAVVASSSAAAMGLEAEGSGVDEESGGSSTERPKIEEI